jgi:GNAT superfamily N-acetyltransferase
MTQDIIIRRFESGDADDVSQLIIDNLMLVNILDYGEAAVRQIARFYSPPWLLEYAQSGETFVAVDRSSIVGTATLEQNRVRNVFVRIDHHRQGIGKILMQHIEGIASKQNKAQLVLLADISAVDFYRKLGYVQGEEKEIEIGDALITVVVMEKTLPVD